MTPKFSTFRRERTFHRDAVACDIAALCAAAVVERLSPDIAAMGVAELRGYIRARALPIVRSHVQKLVAEQRVASSQGNDLIAAALERTVHLALGDLYAPPVVAIPTPHVPMRTAA